MPVGAGSSAGCSRPQWLDSATPIALGAAIGPGIGVDAYEVGPEVRERFAATFGGDTVRGRAADLAGAARIALRRAGIPDSAISSVEACTSSDPGRFFSFRRDGAACGRQAGVVWGVAG